MEPVESRRHHGDGDSACEQGCTVRCRVDAVLAAGDDVHALLSEVPGDSGCGVCSVGCCSSCTHDAQACRRIVPQDAWLPADPRCERCTDTQLLELGWPTGAAVDEYPQAEMLGFGNDLVAEILRRRLCACPPEVLIPCSESGNAPV